MSKGIDIIANAAVTLAAVFVGGLLASQGQDNIWRKEKLYSMRLQLFEKRSQIIKEVSENLADSARFAYIIGPSAPSSEVSKLVYCSDLKHRQDGVDYCGGLTASDADISRMKELASKRAQFESLKTMATIYFCSATKAALNDIPEGDFW